MILLTGATGYLGSQIARALIERKKNFRVYVREPRRLEFNPGEARCEIFVGDLAGPHSLETAMRGVKQVIHAAGLVKMWARDQRDFERVNVDGLQNILRAAATAGVERVVYTSSFIAMGPSANPAAAEGLRHAGHYSNKYEETKALALHWLRDDGFRQFPVLALLPGVIYGPGPATEGNLVGRMIQQYLAGNFPGCSERANSAGVFPILMMWSPRILRRSIEAGRVRNTSWAATIARSTTSSEFWAGNRTLDGPSAICRLHWVRCWAQSSWRGRNSRAARHS